MNVAYLETLTKCPKCGNHYLARTDQKKCPHKFKDKFWRCMTGQEQADDRLQKAD